MAFYPLFHNIREFCEYFTKGFAVASYDFPGQYINRAANFSSSFFSGWLVFGAASAADRPRRLVAMMLVGVFSSLADAPGWMESG